MSAVFADSYYFLARLNPADEAHQRAVRLGSVETREHAGYRGTAEVAGASPAKVDRIWNRPGPLEVGPQKRDRHDRVMPRASIVRETPSATGR